MATAIVVSGTLRVDATAKTIGVRSAQVYASASVQMKIVSHGDVRPRRTQACEAKAIAARVQKRNEKRTTRFTLVILAHRREPSCSDCANSLDVFPAGH